MHDESGDQPATVADGQTAVAASFKRAWKAVYDFIPSPRPLPELEAEVKLLLGVHYRDSDWGEAYNLVLEPDDDVSITIAALDLLRQTTCSPLAPTVAKPACPVACSEQIQTAERDLLSAVDQLRQRNRVRGLALTAEELLDPVEERQIGYSEFEFPNGDEDIVRAVKEKLSGSTVEPETVDDDSDEADEPASEEPSVSLYDIAAMCKQLEKACIEHADAPGIDVLSLQKSLLRFRGHVHRLAQQQDQQSLQQTTLPFKPIN